MTTTLPYLLHFGLKLSRTSFEKLFILTKREKNTIAQLLKISAFGQNPIGISIKLPYSMNRPTYNIKIRISKSCSILNSYCCHLVSIDLYLIILILYLHLRIFLCKLTISSIKIHAFNKFLSQLHF